MTRSYLGAGAPPLSTFPNALCIRTITRVNYTIETIETVDRREYNKLLIPNPSRHWHENGNYTTFCFGDTQDVFTL